MADTEIDYRVTGVTVYPDRARVTCQGRCELTAGHHELIFAQLPLTLDVDSLRVAGRGTAEVRLLSVEVTRRNYEQTPSERVRELEQQIQQVVDDLRRLEDDKAAQQGLANHIDGLYGSTEAFAKGLARGRMKPEDHLRLLQLLHEQDQDVQGKLRELAGQERELTQRLEKLRQDLQALHAERPRQRFEARVPADVTSAGEFEAEISYVVGKAGWSSIYDVRFEPGNGRELNLTALAQITQNSGQPWQDVDLVVSTARPALNQRVPELVPWYVDELRVQPRPLVREVQPMAAMAAAKSAVRDDAVEAEMATATAENTETAVHYRVPGKKTIPSDGSPHKVKLFDPKLDPTLDYVTAPRHTAAVYRRIKTHNAGADRLLAGPANLFVDGEFIGTSQLEDTPPNGALELLLGVEERISVERELVRRDVDKRLLRDTRQLQYGYKITLHNHLDRPVEVEVQDQIPVSRHEQIRVRLERAAPDPAKRSDLNLMEWRLELGPNEEKVITYEYTVEHPRAMQVVGLRD